MLNQESYITPHGPNFDQILETFGPSYMEVHQICQPSLSLNEREELDDNIFGAFYNILSPKAN